MIITENAFYIIDEKFFVDFPDPFLKDNKEAKRPHYYCFKSIDTGIYWVMPLSSRVEKYETIVQNRVSQNKPCDILHIIEMAGKRSVFLVQDMFPITDEYFLREYTIENVHVRLLDKKDIRDIESKAKTILALLRKGVKLNPTQPDVLNIEKILLERGQKNVD